jgi:hypothetical protein
MVVEAAVLGGDRPGSDGRGVVLRPFQKRKGEGRRRLRVRMRGVSGGAGRSAKGRGPVAVWQRWPKRRERRVGRLGWKERRAAAGPNLESGQNSKEIIFEFQLILEFGRTLQIAQGDLEGILT